MKTTYTVSAFIILFISISFFACDESGEVISLELLDKISVEE